MEYICSVKNLIRHIDYLMSRNDCVIIPGVGAVLARYVSARVDAANGVAYPPHREFSFNSALVYNDGTIAHSYVRAMEISYDSALAKVNDAAAKLNAELAATGSVQLGRIGSLEYNDGSLDFMPAPDAFTLSHLPILDNTRIEPQLTPAPEEIAAEMSPRLRWSQRFGQAMRIAASLALLIGICFIASTPIKVDDAALASLSPEFKQATIEDIIAVDEIPADESYCVDVIGANGDYLSMKATARPVKASAAGKKYYIIVGSFNLLSEANKFVEMHPGHNLGILDADKRFRIFDGEYDTSSEAISALGASNFRATGAWICHQ